jgi:hypothetical protein
MDELAGVIGPDAAANVFKGFEAVKTARAGNAKADTERLASVLGAIESMPETMRPDAYKGALDALIADGTLRPGQAPAAYDPAFVKAKRREALTVLEQFTLDDKSAPPKTVTPGQGVLNQATGQYDVPLPVTEKPAAAGSAADFVQRWAADRKLDQSKLSAGQTAAALQAHARATQAPSQAQGPQPGWQWVNRNGEEVYTNRVAQGDRPQNVRAKVTEDERKMAGFYGQMSDAIQTIDAMEGAITEQELYQIQTLPQEKLIGMVNRNELSEGAKRYLRAFEQFTESRLRPVSGAAIADSEYARDRRTYAKQYGETPALAKDRARARALALDSLKKRAGIALDDANDAPTPDTGVEEWVRDANGKLVKKGKT